jgi:hypothetical protein
MENKMPVISRFYGIVIKMYFAQKEHNPPHIHAIYGEFMSSIDINTLEVIEGDIPQKGLNLIREWIKLNKNELLEMWNTQQFKTLNPIE